MSSKLAGVFFGLSALGTGLLFGQVGVKQPVRVTNTEHVNFAPGGTIHLSGSVGNVNIEGWEKPEVEITITKSLNNYYSAAKKDQAAPLLEHVQVKTERRSDTELAISTTVHASSFFRHPLDHTGGVDVEYLIRAPKDSHVVIHHRDGTVVVNDVSGEIEATSRSGDIILMLPDPGPYAIDAKSKFGGVYSDFAGSLERRHWLGEQFAGSKPPAGRRIYLRVGLGKITIQELPSLAEPSVRAQK